MNHYSVPLKQLVQEFNLTVAYQSTDFDEIRVMGTRFPAPDCL